MKEFFMEAMIRLRASEFNESAFERIKSFLAGNANAELSIKISDEPQSFPFSETKEEYFERLNKSIKNAEEGKVTTFTWNEFETYTKQLLNEP